MGNRRRLLSTTVTRAIHQPKEMNWEEVLVATPVRAVAVRSYGRPTQHCGILCICCGAPYKEQMKRYPYAPTARQPRYIGPLCWFADACPKVGIPPACLHRTFHIMFSFIARRIFDSHWLKGVSSLRKVNRATERHAVQSCTKLAPVCWLAQQQKPY